jgi:hypothetical protein
MDCCRLITNAPRSCTSVENALTERGSQRPRCGTSSACLPRHPAVAYLFLVRW